MYDHLNDLKNRLNTIYARIWSIAVWLHRTKSSYVEWIKSTGVTEATATAVLSYPSMEQLYNKRQAALECYRVEYELARGPELTIELAEDEIDGRNWVKYPATTTH